MVGGRSGGRWGVRLGPRGPFVVVDDQLSWRRQAFFHGARLLPDGLVIDVRTPVMLPWSSDWTIERDATLFEGAERPLVRCGAQHWSLCPTSNLEALERFDALRIWLARSPGAVAGLDDPHKVRALCAELNRSGLRAGTGRPWFRPACRSRQNRSDSASATISSTGCFPSGSCSTSDRTARASTVAIDSDGAAGYAPRLNGGASLGASIGSDPCAPVAKAALAESARPPVTARTRSKERWARAIADGVSVQGVEPDVTS